MQSSLKIMTSAGFVLAMVLMSPATIASAGPKEDVAAAATTWGTALAEDTPDKVALYADDAVLWGTLSPKLRADRETMLDYFVVGFKALPNRKVAFGDQLIRIYGDTAINSGYYTFTYVKDGETKTLPARYSFTYRKNGDNWLIVDHHSSAMPAAPK
jgi:uncharacterized protein (TIGR02246 family)